MSLFIHNLLTVKSVLFSNPHRNIKPYLPAKVTDHFGTNRKKIKKLQKKMKSLLGFEPRDLKVTVPRTTWDLSCNALPPLSYRDCCLYGTLLSNDISSIN